MVEDIHKDWKRGDPVGYIRPDIPEFDLPPYQGQRYEAMVPDTLDLAERARLAIHGMTEPTDPQADYEVYWHVLFRCHPPMMRHEWPCISMRPKFEETVSLMLAILIFSPRPSTSSTATGGPGRSFWSNIWTRPNGPVRKENSTRCGRCWTRSSVRPDRNDR